MAVESRRGCGYRKVGGIYLVSDGFGIPCDRLPWPLSVCPTCGAGIKQSRGWTWVDLKALTGGAHQDCIEGHGCCAFCAGTIEKAGLLWIGERFYKTVADFEHEAKAMGISRRVSTVPRGFVVGESVVLLAHPKALAAPVVVIDNPTEPPASRAGIFRIFKPQRIEVLVSETQSKDADYMKGLEERKLTPVIVPDGDKDHQGTVYDQEDPADAGEPLLDAPRAE